jgi:SAM-dependent methyltransferase
MRPEHLQYLVCPRTKRPLELADGPTVDRGRIREGVLREPVSGNEYPIVNFIPRFVPADNYAENFGFQWNKYNRTQYDEQYGAPVTLERFDKETRWPHDLKGEIVLEVGCGSGRFTTHALKTGALVVSFDFSNAVEASFQSNGHCDNLLLVQASVYDMPFPPNFCDKAFCLGVLQHTPDPHQSFAAILDCLKPGGQIASDVYAKDIRSWWLHPKYWVRPFLKNADHRKLLSRVEKYVRLMWPLAKLARKVPVLGKAITSRMLVPVFSKEAPTASDETLKELACLETFDMLSPVYDLPQSLKTFRGWHDEFGLTDVEVHYGYNGIEGRGRKPAEERRAA